MAASNIKELCKNQIKVNNNTYHYYDITKLQHELGINVDKLPFTLKILLENLLRDYDGKHVTNDDLLAFQKWLDNQESAEITFKPARVLLQDFTGVPAVVDLAAMRHKLAEQGVDPKKINPIIPVDLVIDHSIQVDKFGSSDSMEFNTKMEVGRNRERYELLKWAQGAFDNFRVVPPGTGICHQVNLEYFGQVVWTKLVNGENIAYPDTLVGTDSHTTMINALGVLGWGVGGIEAESAMLGQPIPMNIPKVVGVKLIGKLNEGITATDLVLTVTELLRNHGVVGKFVEFYGPGVSSLSLADRATISNMSPEYGATCGYFPVDQTTLDYLDFTARDSQTIDLVKEYTLRQGLWNDTSDSTYSEYIELDLSSVNASVSGPYRPQDRINIQDLPNAISEEVNLEETANSTGLKHADVVIAAITSCTNTSNPHILIAAGLLAKKAVEKGLTINKHIKTSLAPGSKVVTDYLEKTGLTPYLDKLGFNLVAYGCTTCIGNSGPLDANITNEIIEKKLQVSSVLSGNRNFAGRINPHTKLSWLTSPPLVIAYALAGTMNIDLTKESLGIDIDGKPVFLRDIWPTSQEIQNNVDMVSKKMFVKEYNNVFAGDDNWHNLRVVDSVTYDWDEESTYIKNPTFLEKQEALDLQDARILAIFGDTITTDHISPAGAIPENSPTGEYLKNKGIAVSDFNSYGTRRGNHEVMVRASFSNIRIRNEMAPDKEGGYTIFYPEKTEMTIFDAANNYANKNIPVIVIAGKEYGTGSSRDWAAKGTRMLGIKVVIAESYERIHRSNLIGMGVLPLQFPESINRMSLKLTGEETISIKGISSISRPKSNLEAEISYPDGTKKTIELLSRIDTQKEIDYFKASGILNYVLDDLKN